MAPCRRTLAWMTLVPPAWGPGIAWVLQIDPLARQAVTASGLLAGAALWLTALVVTQRQLRRRDTGRPTSAAACARILGFWVAIFAVARWVADHHDPRVPYIEAVSVLVCTLALGWAACVGVFLTVHPPWRALSTQGRDRSPGVRAMFVVVASVLGLLASAGLGVAISARSAGEVDRARLAELEAIADLLAVAAPRIGGQAALATLHGELYIDGAVMPAGRSPAVFSAADAVVESETRGRWLLLFGEARFHLVQRDLGHERLWLWQTAGVGPPVRAPDDASPLLLLALLMLGAPIGAGLIGGDVLGQLAPITAALERMGRQATAATAGEDPGEVPHGSNDEVGDLAEVVNDTIRRFGAQNQRLAAELGAAAGSDRTRTGFLHTASYELRTPLTTITGYCHLLRQTDLADAQREDVRVIADASAQLLSHVDEILDLSRIEAGEEAPLQPIAVDLGTIAQEEMAGHTDRTAPGVHSRLTIADDLPPVWADRTRIRQVVANLVGNALKFTDSGWIELRVADVGDRLGERRAVRLSVEDTGPGIPEDELESIFVEFHRVSEQRGVAGTGLGLAIARRLVERHGGRLWAESTLGEGAVFHLVLPVAEAGDDPPGDA